MRAHEVSKAVKHVALARVLVHLHLRRVELVQLGQRFCDGTHVQGSSSSSFARRALRRTAALTCTTGHRDRAPAGTRRFPRKALYVKHRSVRAAAVACTFGAFCPASPTSRRRVIALDAVAMVHVKVSIVQRRTKRQALGGLYRTTTRCDLKSTAEKLSR